MKMGLIALLLVVSLMMVMPLSAQETVIVPDVVGMTAPQAASILNRAGLKLGAENAIGWQSDSGLAPNTIGMQSVEAGSSIEPDTAIDVTILRSPTIDLIYDDNDLTAVNLSAEPLSIKGLTFTVTEGTEASFASTEWADTLGVGECGQIWSVDRIGEKTVEGCEDFYFLTATDAQQQFWTAANGVVRFSMMENGVELASCEAATAGTINDPLHCSAYLTESEVAQYLYFAYTTDALALINRSSDKWMLTGQTTILNSNSEEVFLLGDPNSYEALITVADITRLAPGQCLLLTSDSPDAVSPEPCDIVAHLELTSDAAFWLADFQIDKGTDGELRQCPAATPEKVTVCVMPR